MRYRITTVSLIAIVIVTVLQISLVSATSINPSKETHDLTVDQSTGIGTAYYVDSNHPQAQDSSDLASLAAFPRAEGSGNDTAYGKGGRIIRVTTLADSGAGSLREALDVKEPREIVFDVGGIIWLKRELEVRHPFVTIAGETAPSPGITLAGAGLRIRTHDVEVRHLRVRVGGRPEGPEPNSRDGLRVSPGADPYEAYNVLFDHCSISWAVDENVSTWASKVSDIVIRNCIISEGLQHSIHPEGAHSCGLLVGDHSQRVVVVGNLLAHNWRRNPYLKGDTSSVVVNNVIYNARHAIHLGDPEGSGPLIASIVGNVLLPGPDYAEPRIEIQDPIGERSAVYLSDNRARLDVRIDTPFDPRVDSPPWWPDDLTALPSDKVLGWVLANAGARPWDRDAVDRRVISDVLNGTGRIINSQAEVGGWSNGFTIALPIIFR